MAHASSPVHRPTKAAAAPSPLDALLAGSLTWRQARPAQPDMVSTDDAAALAGTNRETIDSWIRAGRCIGLERTVRGYRLPRWHFEPAIHKHLPAIARARRAPGREPHRASSARQALGACSVQARPCAAALQWRHGHRRPHEPARRPPA